MTRPIGGERRAVTPGRVTAAGARPERLSIAGRGEASSSVGIGARELHEAFILGAQLRGGYSPFETILLAGVTEAAAWWRWGRHGTRRQRQLRENAAWTGGLKGRGSRSLKQWRMT